jgi:TM2 domain-containing membrane protein YozV
VVSSHKKGRVVYSTGVAYLLLFFFGGIGAHRFYLGKIGTGFLYLFTCGLFGIGWVYDLFTLGAQVREANLRLSYRSAILDDVASPRRPRPEVFSEGPARKKESIEQIILRTAKRKAGVATPAEVALEGGISIDEAKAALEALVKKGHADLRVTKQGGLVYFFPDFSPSGTNPEFEDF